MQNKNGNGFNVMRRNWHVIIEGSICETHKHVIRYIYPFIACENNNFNIRIAFIDIATVEDCFLHTGKELQTKAFKFVSEHKQVKGFEFSKGSEVNRYRSNNNHKTVSY